jgi:DNA repair protein SbcC/Rad50
MFLKLKLRNFQSHKRSELEFHPGLNVIIGPTDSGKSAVFRSLKYVCKNRPSGEEFRSTWGGSTAVTITTDTDEIVRAKDNTNNFYQLNDSAFTAFGLDVPKEIQEALMMDDINFQSQLDPPFLLTESAGEVARHFNKIANLEQIDIANANIKKLISEIESSKKHKEDDLKREEEKLDKFTDLRKFEIDVECVEGMENEISIKRNKRKQLKSLLLEVVAVKEEIEASQKLFPLEKLLTTVFEDKAKLATLSENSSKLKKLISLYKNDSVEIEQANQLISISVLVDSSIKLTNDRANLVSNRDRLNKLIKSVNSNLSEITIAENTFNRLHERFDREMPEVCPLCSK